MSAALCRQKAKLEPDPDEFRPNLTVHSTPGFLLMVSQCHELFGMENLLLRPNSTLRAADASYNCSRRSGRAVEGGGLENR
jgi:hypothetical protein